MKWKGLLVLALTLGMAPWVWAKDMKKSITLSDPAVIGNVTLQPGDYKLEWQGSGPNVQVSFVQGRKTVTTVPATVELKNNAYDQAVQLTQQPSGNKALAEVDWKNMTLVFDHSAASSSQ